MTKSCYSRFVPRALNFAIVALCALGAAALAAPKKTKRKAVATKHKSPPHKPSRFASPGDVTTSPAYRYGMLSAADCEAELAARNISFARETAPGVVAPVRLTGPLHGVEFRTNLSDKARATSLWEIADCRLVLALDDFAVILQRHDIVSVRHYSMYRSPGKPWPEHKPATRHNGAVAIDAARFIAKDGSYLDVDRDFHGAIGAKTCGDDAKPRRATPEALELRTILCEAVEHQLFNVVLTPNYNKPHKNHFHLEVTEGVKWFLVH